MPMPLQRMRTVPFGSSSIVNFASVICSATHIAVLHKQNA